jgi:hypothetical protein
MLMVDRNLLFRWASAAALVAVAGLPLAAQAKQAPGKSLVLSDGSSSVFSPVSPVASQSQGLDLVFNVSGIQSLDGNGSPNNAVFFIQALPGALVDAVAWSVTLQALSPSWLSEMAVSFTNSSGLGVNLRPGAGVNNSGTQSFSGAASLADLGIAFNLDSDGVLRLEFFETFVDFPGGADGVWQSGTVTFGGIMPIPEPGTYGLMALGLLGVAAAARRRRAA